MDGSMLVIRGGEEEKVINGPCRKLADYEAEL